MEAEEGWCGCGVPLRCGEPFLVLRAERGQPFLMRPDSLLRCRVHRRHLGRCCPCRLLRVRPDTQHDHHHLRWVVESRSRQVCHGGVPRLGLHCGHLRLGLARSLLRLLGIGLGLLREALRIGSGLCHNMRNTIRGEFQHN